jgi:glutamate synthase domain-containing protein 2
MFLQKCLKGHYAVFTYSLLMALVSGSFIIVDIGPRWLWSCAAFLTVPLSLLGVHDLFQKRHAVLRNYPISAHLRFLLETIRPEMRQYFFEDEKHSQPFSRDRRSVVYQRAKKVLDKRPFGTNYDVYAPGFEWATHSILVKPQSIDDYRVLIGDEKKIVPYSASLLNISAMSFGSLSRNAVLALNKGSRIGGFFHDTGEGGFSPHHKEHGGDIVWEIGSGYFGARSPEGRFCPDAFRETSSSPQIRMVELKLSQGAKPGHGGVLPAAKVTLEIARTRGVPMGVDCISPPFHSAFSTPVGLLEFIDEMRRLSGGKPAGFKLCIGHPWEFLAVCKAMTETGILPDFIVVDGMEGGTGAAPLEFMDHLGMPLREALVFVNDALIGIGVRDRIRIGASGKIATGFDMARAFALGADWCNAARGFMFALGCIQAQSCHTDRCPTGVATQDPLRYRALDVPDKAQRVANFHRETLHALAEITAAAGLDHPRDFRRHHFHRRISPTETRTFAELYPVLEPGLLLESPEKTRYAEAWRAASAFSFAPAGG